MPESPHQVMSESSMSGQTSMLWGWPGHERQMRQRLRIFVSMIYDDGLRQCWRISVMETRRRSCRAKS